MLFDVLTYLEAVGQTIDFFQSDEEDAKHAARIYRVCADTLRLMV